MADGGRNDGALGMEVLLEPGIEESPDEQGRRPRLRCLHGVHSAEPGLPGARPGEEHKHRREVASCVL